MKRKRRNHSSSFGTKVSLPALKEEKTLVNLSERYDVHNHGSCLYRNLLSY
jgi:hypothetical protein